MKAITVINNKRKCQNKSSMSNEISLKSYLAIQVCIFFLFVKYKMELSLKVIMFIVNFVIYRIYIKNKIFLHYWYIRYALVYMAMK